MTASLNQSTPQSIESANKVSESVLSDDAMHENVMSSTCCISGSKLIAYALPNDSKNARERSNENLPDVASESTSPQKRQIPMCSTDDIDATASLIQSTTQSIESANGPDGRLPHHFDTAIGWHRVVFILASYMPLRASSYVGTIQNLNFTPSWLFAP